MASKEFHADYIGFLQDRNAELLNRLAKMKEIYQNKIFSKDLNQHYLISTLMDVLNVCTALPEEIDMLFEKLSEAMSILINVLSRKSSLLNLGDKISKILNPSDGGDFINVQNTEENNDSTTITREARADLSRISGNYTPRRRSENQRLSPIIEVSPANSPDLNFISYTNTRVNCEQININPATYNYCQESPKGRFKGTKLWKKSISSAKQTPIQKKSFPRNNESIEKEDVRETGQPQPPEINPDPEPDPAGEPSCINDETSEIQSSPKCFIDYRRRRQRYARVFELINKVKDDSGNVRNENVYSSESYDACDITEDSKNLNRESCDDIVGETFTQTDEESTPPEKKITFKRKEPIVLLEDCMIKRESPEKEKKSNQCKKEKISQKSRSKSKSESPTMNSSNEKDIRELDSSKGLTNQEQRLKRKAAPTNLTEPKLGTKLRRN